MAMWCATLRYGIRGCQGELPGGTVVGLSQKMVIETAGSS